MKKCVTWLLFFALIMISCSAMAQETNETYANAPANPTQETVVEIKAEALPSTGEVEPFTVSVMQPTQLTIDTLQELYDFVQVNLNPSVRYFPEETQQEIEAIVRPHGVDKDALFAPKFMSMMPQAFTQHARVEMNMLLEMDFEPGRLVVVILGWETEEGIQWKALDASVPEQNTIHCLIPADVVEEINGRETLFTVLSVKPGGSTSSESEEVPEFVPSKSVEDLNYTEKVFSEDGEEIDCEIVIVEPSTMILWEIEELNQHIVEEDKAVAAFFDEEVQRLLDLMVSDNVKIDGLMAYEMVSVIAEKYKEPYGDVMAQLHFATPYEDGQTVVSVLALPDEEDASKMIWTPLFTEVKNGMVEITFSATLLPKMMEETALLLVLSTPLTE